MVDFSPEAQLGNVPDDTRGYHTITQPKADESLGIALKGAAEVLTGVNKVYQTGMEQKLTSDIEDIKDKQLDPYISSLEAVRNQVRTGNADVGSSNWMDKYDTLLPEDSTQQPPESLKNGIDNINQIGTARAQGAGGKANDTLYTGALYAETKRLKTEHPGWSDYIDDQVKRVTGMDPANAYYRNLLEDINQGLAQKNTVQNQTLQSLRSAADQGFHDSSGVMASDVHALVSSGQWAPEKGLQWLNRAKSFEYDMKMRTDLRNQKVGDAADIKADAQKDLGSMAMRMAHEAWHTQSMGMNTDSPQGLEAFLKFKSTHPDSDEKAQAIGQQMVQYRSQMKANILAEAYKNGMAEKFGGDLDAMNKTIDASLVHYDQAIQDVFNQNWGAAYSNANFNKAITEDTTNKLFNIPDEQSRRFNRSTAAVAKLSPQFYNQYFKDAVIGGVPDSEQEFVKGMSMQMLAQPDGTYGHLTSIQDTINRAKQAGITSPKTYNEFIGFASNINNKDISDQQRLNLALAFFDPQKNGALLSDQNFRKDYTDPKTGRTVPGKYSVFQRLSSDDVAAGIADLSKRHPEIGHMYRETMEKQFGEYLWKDDINGMAGKQSGWKELGNKVKFVNDGGNQVPRFELWGHRPLFGGDMPINDTLVNRLNGGIAGMYRVYKALGDPDPGQTILGTMYKYTNPINRTGPSSNMLWQSIVTEQGAQAQKAADEMRRKPKVPTSE